MVEIVERREHGNVPSRSYSDLRVWSASLDLAADIYRVTSRLPGRETFGLVAQLRRAAVSVPSNIAEGQARAGTRDFPRFLAIARGSLAEIDTQLILAARLGYVNDREIRQVQATASVVARMIRRLEQALRRRQPPQAR